jgi:hypothetical protein
MKNLFIPADEAAGLIRSGAIAIISGVESMLASLPSGRWVGGTTPYFMAPEGGRVDQTHLFCSIIEEATDARAAVLPPDSLPNVVGGRYANGFSYLVLPAFSEAHRRYALEAASYPGLYDQPIMGWITGVHLSEIGKKSPRVFNGFSGQSYDNAAVVLHVGLVAGVHAEIDIVNLFAQGDGAAIVFPETGLSGSVCTIDGKRANFARWLTENGIDTRLPLVANYVGAMVNVSIQDVDVAKGRVQFYAPVVAGETYRIARPIADYASAYGKGLGANGNAAAMLSCNCILNFLYASLEGRTTGGFVGPVTFGEVAYILLNQTLVRLSSKKAVA